MDFYRKTIKKVKTKITLDCVILFGSRARSDFTPYSDIDLIFVGNFKEKFINRSSLILELLSNSFGVGLDVFCYTSDEFKDMFYQGTVSILDAIDHGVCLFGVKFYKEYKNLMEDFKNKGLKRDPPVWIILEDTLID